MPKTNLAYFKLEEAFQFYYLLKRNLSILNWDSAVVMPKASGEIRGKQISAQTKAILKTLNDPSLVKLFDSVNENADSLDNWQKANFDEMKRIYKANNAIPQELSIELSEQSVKCELTWREARKNNDFKLFAKAFSPLLDLIKKKSEFLSLAYKTTPYLALLREYDPHSEEDDLTTTFDILGKELPKIINIICLARKAEGIKAETLPSIDLNNQKAICHRVMTDLGFNFNQGRLDESEHPFTEGGVGDIRVTTNYYEKDFRITLLSAIHECGHALYDSHLPRDGYMQPVGCDRGMSIHEGIALFYEMVIAGSKQFAEYLSSVFSHFGVSCKAEQIYNSLNTAKPGLIRIDADEVTYLPHIILRYEIETKLLDQSLKIDEIPDFWNSRLFESLQVQPTNYSEGCLQDIHWALGLYGYFPTYARGLLFASQLEKKYHQHIKDLNLNNILVTLEKDIFSKGCFFDEKTFQGFPPESRATEVYLNYIKSKYKLPIQ